MSKVLDIALKDIRRSMRSAIGLVFMFGLPLMVTALFYFMFGSSAREGEFNLPRTKVVIANLDRDAPRLEANAKNLPGGIRATTMSDLVVKVLQNKDLNDLLEVQVVPDADSARHAVDSQQAQVAIIIPAGFSRRFSDPYEQAEIQFYQDPTLVLGPGIVRSILAQFMDGLSGVKIVVDLALDQLEPNEYNRIGGIVEQYMADSPDQSKDLAASLLEEHRAKKPTQNTNSLVRIIGPIMGGMMVFFGFYTGTSSAESLLREEEEGTLPRLFTTPTSQATILSGSFLAVFLTVFVQIVVMLIAGRLIFGIEWGSVYSVILVAPGIVAAAASLGIFINSWLKDTKQGGVIFGGVLTLTGMLGMMRVFGFSAGGSSGLFNAITLLVPQGWAVRGLLLLFEGVTGSALLLNTLVLLGWSIVFFGVGVWRFNQRYR